MGFEVALPPMTHAAELAHAAAIHSPARLLNGVPPPQSKKKRIRSEGEGEVEALMIQLQFEERQQMATAASPSVNRSATPNPLTSAPAAALTPLEQLYPLPRQLLQPLQISVPAAVRDVSLAQMPSLSRLHTPPSTLMPTGGPAASALDMPAATMTRPPPRAAFVPPPLIGKR